MRKLLAQGKRFWATVAAVLTPIFWLSGGLVDLPNAIFYVISRGPDWLTNPDLWWFVAFLIVEGAVIRWIWKQPDKEPASKPENEHKKQFMEALADAPLRVQLQYMLLEEIQNFKELVASFDPNKINSEYVVNMLEFGYKSRIEDLLGNEVYDRYRKAILESKKTQRCKIVAQASVPIIEHALLAELERFPQSATKPDIGNT